MERPKLAAGHVLAVLDAGGLVRNAQVVQEVVADAGAGCVAGGGASKGTGIKKDRIYF